MGHKGHIIIQYTINIGLLEYDDKRVRFKLHSTLSITHGMSQG